MPSIVFSATLPVKPSVTTTSTIAGADVVALDEAVEIDRRALAAQPGRGLAQLVVALELLGADIEQADRGLVEAEQDLGEDAAHDGELGEIVGVAFEVGAEVEHHRLAAHGRQERGERRPVRALEHAHGKHRDGEQRAGVAGRDDACRRGPAAAASTASHMLDLRRRRSAKVGLSSAATTSSAGTISSALARPLRLSTSGFSRAGSPNSRNVVPG